MSLLSLGRYFRKPAAELFLKAAADLDKPKQRRHELWALSCYIDPGRFTAFLADLAVKVRLTDVNLAFNFAEAYRIGSVETKQHLLEIEKWCKKRHIHFEWRALSAGTLVHSKGYAIFQRVNDEIASGTLLIGSANMTSPGFFDGGNIELGCFTSRLADLRDFERLYDRLWEDFGTDIDEQVFRQDLALFKYSLLSSGVFLHKWDGSLAQMVGLKYQITELGKKQAQLDPELIRLGFEMSDSLTRQVLKLHELPRKEIPGEFTKRFTVDTFMGRWCPSEAWREVAKRLEGADSFISAFNEATTDEKLMNAASEAKAVHDDLIVRGLLKPVASDYLDRWIDRIKSLRENSARLERLFSGYEDHKLAYDPQSVREIDELFESLMESIELAGKKNWAMQQVLSAVASKNLHSLSLDAETKEQLVKALVG